MIFLQFLFTLGLTYQISQLVSESSFPLFRWLRTFQTMPFVYISELVSCFLCTSVWVGIWMSYQFFDISSYLGYNSGSYIWSGLFYSCFCWFIHVWENKQ